MNGPIDLARVRGALAQAPASELLQPRRAAVAVVLAAGPTSGSLAVLLLRRTEREGDPWSGHMALPGGHAQPEDADLLHTARRETLEEVGIDLAEAELLGRLDDVSPMRSSEMAVRPFVFWLGEQREAQLSAEVAEVLWVPLDDLATDALRGMRDVELRGTTVSVPAYVIDQRVVWGMTFHLLERLFARVLAFA
jgi:8-oxo-dGTP pyrophosphatase MutT (NUDIX family)